MRSHRDAYLRFPPVYPAEHRCLRHADRLPLKRDDPAKQHFCDDGHRPLGAPAAMICRQSRRAQALVEFAMVAPIFFVLLFGIIEGGRFIFYYETLNNATREGARYAIV